MQLSHPPEWPDWFLTRRLEATDRVAERPLPSTDDEAWRYSRIAEFDPSDWTTLVDRSTEVPAEAVAVMESLGHNAAGVIAHDGSVVAVRLDDAVRESGVFVGSILDAPDGAAMLGSVLGDHGDAFAARNDAALLDALVIDVPDGAVLDAPIVIVDWVSTAGASIASRIVVRVGANAQATVLEWQGSDDIAAFVAPVVEIDLHPAGRLGYGSVQSRGPRVWQIASQVARVERDATLRSSQVALGGDSTRLRTDCRLVGRGASGDLHAVYFGQGTQTLDFRTFQIHDAPDTTSNLLFKGAVDDSSRSVYTGLIRVEEGARGTSAFQTNRNLKLSDDAWADSVPNLEIETNDVKCSHASTVGPIDEDQRFYLESRGVPTAVAERLVVAGFFDEVLEQFPVPSAVPLVEAAIAERLERSNHGGDGR